ncbi:MAG: hypothetical protein KAR47_00735 [Planctomycetes bacterium]|nr:hypothetical protein [Planctomycetota bacterium]
MKDYLKDPNFYYTLIPTAATIWALLACFALMPAASNEYQEIEKDYYDSKDLIGKIIAIDPSRLDYKQQKSGSAEFDYATAVEDFAKINKIAPSNYSLRGGKEVKRSGRRTKSADMTINAIGIENFAKFLSSMVIRWSDLKCELLTLTKLKSGPDSWKATVKFTYYY